MNLTGWADGAWADGAWVPESWGVVEEEPAQPEQPRRKKNFTLGVPSDLQRFAVLLRDDQDLIAMVPTLLAVARANA